jgi:hypothetical protein
LRHEKGVWAVTFSPVMTEEPSVRECCRTLEKNLTGARWINQMDAKAVSSRIRYERFKQACLSKNLCVEMIYALNKYLEGQRFNVVDTRSAPGILLNLKGHGGNR